MSFLNERNDDPKIKVLVCTCNLGNAAPNYASISEWIPNDGETKSVLQNQRYPVRANATKELTSNGKNENFHIIAIGMQEATFDLSEKSSDTFMKKVTTAVEQATKDAKYVSNHSETNPDDQSYDEEQCDTRYLHRILENRLPSYSRAVSHQRGQMRLMIFYDENEISLDVLSVKAENTGRGGLANKGGIVAECDVNSGTRISFLTAHLEAHEGLSKYKTRCSTISDIFKGTTSTLANSYCDVSMTSHFTFAMGDLNFRTRLPNYEIGSDRHIEAAHALARRKDWATLNEYDELSLALRKKKCLVGFLTPKCDFPPTFKVERKHGYNYLSNRSPSYTDRILFKANHKLSKMIEVQAYGPIDHYTTSDHKPIRGAFEIQPNRRLRFRPILTRRAKGIRLSLEPLKRGSLSLRKSTGELRAQLLHFSFSSIACEFDQDLRSSLLYMPSPCVSFIPTPSDAIKTKKSGKTLKGWWRRINKTMVPVAMKWPHTKAITNTFDPDWEGTETINFVIRSHLKNGAPVDLTGAMLHILVHDAKDNLKLMGSCSLNLASLIMDSTAQKEVDEKSLLEQLQGQTRWKFEAVANRLLGSGRKGADNPRGYESSLVANRMTSSTSMNGARNRFFASEWESTLSSAAHTDANFASVREGRLSKHTSTKDVFGGVTEKVLMKDGREVGTIKFNVDTRWLSKR